jgi:prephenate dehydrogenase
LSFSNIGIVGLGLIGGSLARRIRKVFPSIKLFGCEVDDKTLKMAQTSALFEKVGEDVSVFPSLLDVVFVCTPMDYVVQTVEQVAQYLESAAIITDVSSVKSFTSAIRVQPPHLYISGHPMAGKEVSGFAAADSELLQGATYILSPVDDPRLQNLTQFLIQLGCRVLTMENDEHDRYVAAASHIPYLMSCLAVASAEALIAGLDSPFPEVAAGGFRDATRVAASPPRWGGAVCLRNRQPLLEGLEAATQTLAQVKTWIQDGNGPALESFFASVKHLRDKVYPHV